VGVTHSYNEVHQFNGTSYIMNVKPNAGLSLQAFKNLNINLSGEYVLFNQYDGDYSANASIAYDFTLREKNYGKLSLQCDYGSSKPDWFYSHYYSTYYKWDYDFDDRRDFHAGLLYNYGNFYVGADMYNMENMVYMDVLARPKQYTGKVVNVYTAHISKSFNIGIFRIDNKVIYQYTDKSSLLRLPMISASQSYIFTWPMFKKALLTQAGIDLFYNTKYYADAYQPELRSFCLQNDRQLGNYLYTDVFLNLKIKRARIFLKLTNVLSGLIGYDNFTVPHYPMQDRLFKFGIGWVFYD
jgi:hypothetical protein